jgi:hypothetical protein
MKRILGWTVGLIVTAILALGITWAIYAPPQALRGTWKTEGYGLVLDVSALRIKVYQTSDIHCLPDQTIPGHMGLVNLIEGVTIAEVDDRMIINVAGTLNPIYADPIDAIPALCATPPANDPTSTFDVMWEVMNRHYAHFDLHGVDWAARKALRPAPGTRMSDADLLALLKEALTDLDDGHTYVATGDTIWSPSEPTTWHNDRHMMRDATLAVVADLSEPSETGLRVGWATPTIGYVYMTHMDPQAGIGQRAHIAASSAFGQIRDYFAQADGIILDVRYNPGGSDDISMAYAGFFTDTTLPVFTKSTRTDKGYTAPFVAEITPQPNPLTDTPVVLLTGPYTGSAAEIFTLAMRELPQVTTLGQATSGGLSDILSVQLPNGWELGLSHQNYLTMDGTAFEGIGIPPDVTLPVDIDAARTGQDTTLEQAIVHLQAR